MRGGLATASATRTPEPRRPARVPFVAARLFPSLSWCSLLLVCLRLTPAAVRTAWSLSCLRSHFRAPLFVSAGWLPFAQPDAHASFGITRFCLLLLVARPNPRCATAHNPHHPHHKHMQVEQQPPPPPALSPSRSPSHAALLCVAPVPPCPVVAGVLQTASRRGVMKKIRKVGYLYAKARPDEH